MDETFNASFDESTEDEEIHWTPATPRVQIFQYLEEENFQTEEVVKEVRHKKKKKVRVKALSETSQRKTSLFSPLDKSKIEGGTLRKLVAHLISERNTGTKNI